MTGSCNRNAALLLAAGLLLTAGCDKTGTTGAAGAGPGKSADSHAKKLIGTWEGADNELRDKDGKAAIVTVVFAADGKMTIATGPFELRGTYKVAKEDGKTLTLDTEQSLELPGLKRKDDNKAKSVGMTVIFDGDDVITMSPTDKKDPKQLKRKK
jgi:hypothetical protein